MAEISVIIPVYNVEKYLKKCLDSVINQTFNDIEIICVDDGSSDSSSEILQEYAKKDSRIIVLTQSNSGVSIARNNGLKKATGKYIYLCDSDDYLHTQCLEIAHYFALMYSADMVCFNFVENDNPELYNKKINPQEIEYKITTNPVLEGSYKEKFKVNFNVWTKLYKKDLLKGIEFIEKIHFEDYPHTFAVMAKMPKTVIINQALYFYAINQGSLSHTSSNIQHIKDYRIGIDYIYEIYNKPELQKELAFLKINFIPNILKQQFNRCRRADKKSKPEMFACFIDELKDLKKKNMLSWRGHKLSRYIRYIWLMKKGY